MVQYIRFKDDTIIIFNGSFHGMLQKLSITSDDIASFGTVEVNRWVCYFKDKKRDIEATLLLRKTLNV